jgi:hypothetical protein
VQDSAAVIARPAAVICCIGRTGQPYYWPTLISADAFKASSTLLSRKVSALRSRLGIPVFCGIPYAVTRRAAWANVSNN